MLNVIFTYVFIITSVSTQRNEWPDPEKDELIYIANPIEAKMPSHWVPSSIVKAIMSGMTPATDVIIHVTITTTTERTTTTRKKPTTKPTRKPTRKPHKPTTKKPVVPPEEYEEGTKTPNSVINEEDPITEKSISEEYIVQPTTEETTTEEPTTGKPTTEEPTTEEPTTEEPTTEEPTTEEPTTEEPTTEEPTTEAEETTPTIPVYGDVNEWPDMP